jgi:dTDP-4-dehydrorhamnose reductase
MRPPALRKLAWITGAGGLIGNCLARLEPAGLSGWAVRPLSRPDLDLLDLVALEDCFQREQPDLVFHCAALSKSPACEANPGLAWRTNVEVTAHLASLALSIPFFFLSTDLVFDGRKGAYREEDQVNPLSTYARTKAAAE